MKFITVIIVCLFSIMSYSQAAISGKFADQDQQPQNNVVVQLLQQKDSVQVSSVLSDQLGGFGMKDIHSGDYLLCYTSKEMDPQYIKVNVADSDVNIGVISINKPINTLSEVVVATKKPLFEPQLDKIVVNVQENLSFAGGTALEILSRSPGVNISKEKNTISLNGKSEILIMLDGKITRLPVDALIQMLDGMPSQNVQKIELIGNPSAKYDAGGTGGIINIILVKGKNDGLNGSTSLTGGWGGKEKIGATANLNYRKENLNLYGNAAYYRNHKAQTYDLYREINNEGEIYKNKVFTDRDPLSDYFSVKFGTDYDVNKATKVGGFISGMADVFHLNADTEVTDIDNLGNQSFTKVDNKEKNIWSNLTSNIYLNRVLNEKQDINFDFTYLYYYNTNNLTNLNSYYDSDNNFISMEKIDGNKDAPVNAFVSSVDYSNKLTEKSKLEIGLKSSNSRYTNDIEVFKDSSIDHTLTQVFTLSEDIFAVYGNYNINLSEKTELQTGIRYEYFDLVSNGSSGTIKRHSGDFFPTIYLSHKFSDNKKLQLSYNRRVSRPSYNDFAPYFVFIDPSTSFTGNEALDQSISDGYKIDYLYSKCLFSFQYAHEDNGISRFQPQADLDGNTLFFSSLNLKYKDIYTLLFSFPIKVTPWWNIQNNIMGVKQMFRTKHLEENITFDNNYLELNSTFSFDLPKKFSVELSGFYHTAQLYGFSKNKEFGNANIGIVKKVNDKNKLTLTVNNLLETYKDWDIVDNQGLDYFFYAQYNLSPVTVRLTYNYTFGGSKSGARKKGAGSEDIESRIR